MDVALFILHCHPLIVAELRQHNADEQRVALCARNKLIGICFWRARLYSALRG
jgi:hypothetical protein